MFWSTQQVNAAVFTGFEVTGRVEFWVGTGGAAGTLTVLGVQWLPSAMLLPSCESTLFTVLDIHVRRKASRAPMAAIG